MFSVAKSRLRSILASRLFSEQMLWCNPGFARPISSTFTSPNAASSYSTATKPGLLEMGEVEEILNDVKAGDVKVIPVQAVCQWTDFMVIATGRSAWHVRNIAQALIHKVKEKQKGAAQLLLPSVEGYEGGKWIIIDSGNVIVHALDEKARIYYNLESLWTSEKVVNESNEEME